jgi:hypothetical protein
MAKLDVNNDERFYFDRKNYFHRFLHDRSDDSDSITNNQTVSVQQAQISRHVRHALEYFVNDLRRNRNKTIERFLLERNVDDILRSIAQLLLINDDRY